MCRVLSIPRSVYYYKSKEKSENSILASSIKSILSIVGKAMELEESSLNLTKKDTKSLEEKSLIL